MSACAQNLEKVDCTSTKKEKARRNVDPNPVSKIFRCLFIDLLAQFRGGGQISDTCDNF